MKIYSKLTFFCKVRRIPNDDTTPSRPATWAPPVNVDVPAVTSRWRVVYSVCLSGSGISLSSPNPHRWSSRRSYMLLICGMSFWIIYLRQEHAAGSIASSSVRLTGSRILVQKQEFIAGRVWEQTRVSLDSFTAIIYLRNFALVLLRANVRILGYTFSTIILFCTWVLLSTAAVASPCVSSSLRWRHSCSYMKVLTVIIITYTVRFVSVNTL